MHPRAFVRLRIGIILANIAVMCITLTAGLWPFAFHVRNGASWSSNPAGIQFRHFATARGDSPFQGSEICPSTDSPFALELWIQPEKASGYGTILAFDSDEHPESLSIRQSLGDIEFVRSFRNDNGKTLLRTLYIDDVLLGYQPRFLTLTSNSGQTRVFVDGKCIEKIRNLDVKCRDLQGTLILGTAPTSNDTWSGTLLGLAVYGRALDVDDARNHYQAWTAHQPADLRHRLNAYALYLFDEGFGRTARNAVSGRWSITIPQDYSIKRKRFLQPFWEEFTWDRAGAVDVAINIVGFIPFGFCLAALVRMVLRRRHYLAASILLGLGASLTIEVIQAYMPIRYSGTLDLITNTSGAAIGAALFRLLANRFLRMQPGPELEEKQTARA